MADIYKVNSDNIIGGPGRLVFKVFDGVYPVKIDDVMSLTDPYALTSPWQDLGATSDGISITRSFSTQDFEVDQVFGAVDTDITSWSHSLKTNLAENTVENRQLALVGGAITTTNPVIGSTTPLTAAANINDSVIKVTSATGLTAGGFVKITEGAKTETKKISSVAGTTVTLESPLKNSYTTTATAAPVTSLGYKQIGFGTVSNLPTLTFALISQKKDGSLYMAVIRKAKISGDDKELAYSKDKRLIPLSLTAYPDSTLSKDSNVFYEIEQVIS